jgi:hypothetical protein
MRPRRLDARSYASASRRPRASDAWSARWFCTNPRRGRRTGCSRSHQCGSVRYRSNSNSSVTARRFSSLWTWDQLGSDRARLLVERRRREQPPLQLGIAQSVGCRPRDADDGGAPQILANCRPAQPGRNGDLPLAHVKGVPQPQNFSNLPRRRSLGGHRTSPCIAAKGASSAMRSPTSRASSRPHQGGRLRSEWAADFRRNRWPLCVELRTRGVAGSSSTTNSTISPACKRCDAISCAMTPAV